MIEEVRVEYFKRSEILQVEWTTSPKSDLLADQIILLLMQAEQTPSIQVNNLINNVQD